MTTLVTTHLFLLVNFPFCQFCACVQHIVMIFIPITLSYLLSLPQAPSSQLLLLLLPWFFKVLLIYFYLCRAFVNSHSCRIFSTGTAGRQLFTALLILRLFQSFCLFFHDVSLPETLLSFVPRRPLNNVELVWSCMGLCFEGLPIRTCSYWGVGFCTPNKEANCETLQSDGQGATSLCPAWSLYSVISNFLNGSPRSFS